MAAQVILQGHKAKYTMYALHIKPCTKGKIGKALYLSNNMNTDIAVHGFSSSTYFMLGNCRSIDK
jgi:hypothetical protein